jgi:glycerol-3-phosphate dehydrogenase subunit C
MAKITRDSLLTLEAYARERDSIRTNVIAHKKRRKVHLGEHITLIFEDEMTIRYQIQEMLRAERIFEDDRIQEELDAYNPLVPDGRNLKATMLLEFSDPAERHTWLQRLIGVEDKVWIQVQGNEKSWAIADEDLDRENSEKTSAVHFLRFELSKDMAQVFKSGARISIGIDHPNYCQSTELSLEDGVLLARDIS